MADGRRSIVDELVRALRQPHIAAELETKPFQDIHIELQDGKVVMIRSTAKLKPTA